MATTRLQPGDVMLYRPTGIFGRLIALKTWHAISHVEVAVGPGKAIASRDALGVNEYPIRWAQLAAVLRPDPARFDMAKAMEYFKTVKGQPYDFLGLLAFFRTKGAATNGKQFCSEFATNFYRAGGLDPFDGEAAQTVPPFYFDKLADGFTKIWSDTQGVIV
jgi:hypothetical protein